jgi:hypothetical protein
MPGADCVTAAAIAVTVMTVSQFGRRQGPTIPEMIATGAVESVATEPSGAPPPVVSILRLTDLVVTGTIGEPRGYLSDDQRSVQTDYPILGAVVLFETKKTIPKSGVSRDVIVTQFGGTALVGQTAFTEQQPALEPLPSGRQGLFLLRHVGDKYWIAGQFYGAFDITNGRLKPLTSKPNFAAEYQDVPLSEALDSVLTILSWQEKFK